MDSLVFYYGVLDNHINITDRVRSLCYIEDQYVVIPGDDGYRNVLFTDPCHGVSKSIFVHGLSPIMAVFPVGQDIFIDLQTMSTVQDSKIQRKLIHRVIKDPDVKVRSLHKYIQLDYGSMIHEYPEQCMAAQFIRGDEKVLEIGANIGRNTCLIACLLRNERNLVTLESNPQIAAQLIQNRDKNGFHFEVEAAALSKRRLFQKGWKTVAADEPPEGYTEILTVGWEGLKIKHGVEFDTLVLDCEGALHPILYDTPELLDSINMVILENDFESLEHKQYVDECFTRAGLKRVFVQPGNEEAKALGFACLDCFYEVWKRPESESAVVAQARTTYGGKFMEKYPHVFLFRYPKYNEVDAIFEKEESKLNCAVTIIETPEQLVKMFDPNYPILVTYGPVENEYYKDVYSVIVPRFQTRWIHMKSISNLEQFSYGVNYCYINTTISEHKKTRPVFSIFTSCYNSYDKINRAYNSLLSQTERDWEWVILDDSPDDAHFGFLRTKFAKDSRIRLYRRSANSGNIGNVKNETVGLCRGSYVLELDHDDEILPSTLAMAKRTFEEHADVGFVYTDFINIYENGNNFKYSDFISLGYGCYYCQKYKGRWVYVYITPNINNITMSHIVSVPNHPRIWRRDVLFKLGNYSEFLPICDDYELLLRTAMQTKMAKICTMTYVQYMNNNNNNFSLIRNKEINRLTPRVIMPQFFQMYNVHDHMKSIDAYEDSNYIYNHSPIWKRKDYEHKHANLIIQYDYDIQYCILGIEAFEAHREKITEAYKNQRADFILLDGKGDNPALWKFLDENNFSRMKCYSLVETPKDELINFFNLMYKSCKDTEILAV